MSEAIREEPKLSDGFIFIRNLTDLKRFYAKLNKQKYTENSLQYCLQRNELIVRTYTVFLEIKQELKVNYLNENITLSSSNKYLGIVYL